MQALDNIVESTLRETSSYHGSILVNVVESIMRTSQKTITIDIKGKQKHPKQIIFYRGDAAEIYGEGDIARDARVDYHHALNLAAVLTSLFNQKFVGAPLAAEQQPGVTIREQDEDGIWRERTVDLIALRHPESAKVSFLRSSAMYYRGVSQNFLDAFVKIIEKHRDQA